MIETVDFADDNAETWNNGTMAPEKRTS